MSLFFGHVVECLHYLHSLDPQGYIYIQCIYIYDTSHLGLQFKKCNNNPKGAIVVNNANLFAKTCSVGDPNRWYFCITVPEAETHRELQEFLPIIIYSILRPYYSMRHNIYICNIYIHDTCIYWIYTNIHIYMMCLYVHIQTHSCSTRVCPKLGVFPIQWKIVFVVIIIIIIIVLFPSTSPEFCFTNARNRGTNPWYIDGVEAPCLSRNTPWT